VVVDLFHPASYTTRIDGSTLVLSIGSGNASTAAVTSITSNDPSKAMGSAGRPEISNIDFRRGKNGEGRLIVSFSGDGVSADLQRSGTKVTVELSNVRLPDKFAQRLDVTDFATPVQSIETRPRANGARVELNTTAAFEQLAYQTGNEYVVEVTPVREESAEAKAREIAWSGERVTFNFQDIPVRSVLQLIADVSELNVVVSDTVTGNVTLRLINVPWDQALDIILRTKGLDKRRQGNVIWVAPTAEISQREQALEDARIALEDRAEVVTEFVPINFASAKEIADLLTKGGQTGPAAAGGAATGSGKYRGFLSSRGSISFDERTNTLLINDIPRKVREIKEVIALLDRAVDQVLIEARIAVAGEDFSHALGAKFGVSAATRTAHGNLMTTSGTAGRPTDDERRVSTTVHGSAPSSGRPGWSGSAAVQPLRRLNVNLPWRTAAGSFRPGYPEPRLPARPRAERARDRGARPGRRPARA
jgi:type IV pilus assembly protein PilQ